MKHHITAALLFVSLFAGCNSKHSSSTIIRVAYAPVVLNVPLYLAQDRGLFQNNDVKVETRVFTSANDMINAVVADQADAVTGVSLVPILNLEAQYPGKVRVILHSKMTDEQPYDGLIVKADSTIRSLQDLQGHKVGLYPGTTAINLLRAFLKKNGISADGIEFIQLPPASHVNALQSGAVDVLMAYEPTLTTLLQQGGFRRIYGSLYVAMQDPSPISSSVVARRFERASPDATLRFIRSLDSAIGIVRDDPSAARLSLTHYTKIPTDIAPHVNLVADCLSTETNEASLQEFIDLLVEIGELPKRVNAKDLLAPTR